MNKVLSLIYRTIIFIIITSCNNNYPFLVTQELKKMSKVNQKKFIKVFNHYNNTGDSLKLKAAYFIVENVNDFGFYIGKQIDNYNVIFDVLANKPADYRENLPWYSNEINKIFDSLEVIYGPFKNENLRWVSDADVMTTDFMIQYIDKAFVAWQRPWSRHLSFENFCEYILPYRNFAEPIEDWRSQFLSAYSWIMDSVNSEDRIMDVARKLNYDTELKYSSGFERYIVNIPPSRLLQAKYGNCADNSNYKAMIMRAYGIPVAIDYFPQYGTDHNIHYWNAIMYDDGKFVSFKDSLKDINASVAYKYTIAKVFRRTFLRNPELQELIYLTNGQVPTVFKNMRLKDVTAEYVPITNIDFPILNLPQNINFLFLAVFNDAGWSPIDFASVEDNSHIIFKNLGRQVVYLPVYIQNDYFIPVDYPFKINADGEMVKLIPRQNLERVVLTRKYHFHRRKLNWIQCIKWGRFEGANQPDFSDATTLAIIQKTPSEHYNDLKIINSQSFRFFRFVFSKDELSLPYDGDGASIAEIECFSPSGEKIFGKPIGSPGRKYNPYTPDKCFDGDALTFFEDARYIKETKFVGLEFDKPEEINRIRFVPRNDMNSVQPGDKYELLFWFDGRFKSLGQQIAKDTMLIYTNVPDNALLWLRNLSGGKEERIFTWEDGKQIWW